MSYQHKKGKIQNNAIEALLHDPLFKQRIEINRKGKGSYRRKDKHWSAASYQEGNQYYSFWEVLLSLLSQNRHLS